MIIDAIKKLIKQKIHPKEYYEILNNLDKYILKDENIIEVVSQYLEKYKESVDLYCIIDIFLQLKQKDIFEKSDIESINRKIISIYDSITDSNMKYFLLGYLLQNNLEDEIKLNDINLKKHIQNRKDEKELANCIVKAIEAFDSKSSMAIKYWCEQVDENQNIFKVGELVREKIFNDKELLCSLNEIINNMLNNLIEENDNNKCINVLNFILSIYQDNDFVDNYVINNNFPIINILLNKLDDRFINNLFIEIAIENDFNKITNTSILNITGNEHKLDSDLKNAARGEDITIDDYQILDAYLNKLIKSKNNINIIKLEHSYSANEILDLTKCDVNKEIDLKHICNILNINYYEADFSGNIYGFSIKLESKNKAAIIINRKRSLESRKRFTIAHEIGHICNNNIKKFSDDMIYNIQLYKQDENEADEFAGKLLLPQSSLNKFIKNDINISVIQKIAAQFNVSLEATAVNMVKRSDEGYIFMLLENNVEKYKVFSKTIVKLEVTENMMSFIYENDFVSKPKWIEKANISIFKLKEFKYVILNYVYSY